MNKKREITKTIVISLGGSLVVPDEIDVKFLLAFKKIIEQSVKKGFHFVITLGGGKVCRRYQEAARLVARPKPFDLDWIGIASLRLNAELMRVILGDLAHGKVLNSPREFVSTRPKKAVVVCGAFGPGRSSDFDAVLFAEKVGAGTIINLSNIDYVYDKDPRKYKNAKPIKQISWIDFRKILPKKWNPGSNTPFDPVASVKAQKLGLKVVVMNSANSVQVCQNCQQKFTIEPDDFAFYEKIKVPPPTWCFECRQWRRYAWRNERTLYRRNCDLCGKSTVTIYSPNKPYKVYCHDCWWGDGWDPASYGVDFDFSRPFFEQFHELQLKVPRMALLNKNSVNSEYTNHSGDNKNVYLSFACFLDENVMYSTWVMKSRDCMDCGFIAEKGERLYAVLDSSSSYQCQYGIFLKNCLSCYYCYDCRGCNDCFMSSNLRNKSYVFKNVQYTREAYLEKIKALNLSSFEIREKLTREFEDFLEKDSIHRYVISERNVNSVGSLIYDCKNVKESFEVNKGEDSKYIYGGIETKNCMDLYYVGYNVELCYECQGCTRISNCQFCHLCYDNMNVSYGDTCQNSQNLFGCVGVKKGEYMIFNKKYNKEDYLILREKIIEHMKNTEEYGEFFPPQIAPVCYNETQGQFYNPMTKEEVLVKGWKWEDQIHGTFGKETFYKRENIPIPKHCPNCRYVKRFTLRLPRKLWHRTCMCDKKNHHNHNAGKCEVEFETSYAPERPEIVYCEKCYQQEVY